MTTQANTYQLTKPSWRDVTKAQLPEQFMLFISLIVVDLSMVMVGFWLAYALRFNIGFSLFYQYETPPYDFYQWFGILLIPIWFIIFLLFGLYDFRNLFSGMREYARTFNACTLGIMVVILLTFLDPNLVVARGWVVLSWLLVSLSVGIGRFIMRRIVQSLRVKGHFQTTVLIVGANEEGQAIARQLQANRKTGVSVIGFVDDNVKRGSEPVSDIPVLSSIDSIATLVKFVRVHEIIVASTAVPREKFLGLFQSFGTDDDINIRMSSGIYELMTTGVEVQEIGNVPLLSINKVRLTGGDLLLKAALDLFGSIAALLISLPIMAVIAVAVALDSPGPIFYRRRVVGVGGKLFYAFKFRTMHIDADERLAQDPELRRKFEENQKLKDDPRVTRIGRFLRRTSLDEFPQFLNVLLGQMSLVGPRMITDQERALYGKWQMNLSTVKPGMTGLWQVSGRSDVSYEKRVMLDMHYIRNYSIWLDLHLLLQTIPAVIKSRGAY